MVGEHLLRQAFSHMRYFCVRRETLACDLVEHKNLPSFRGGLTKVAQQDVWNLVLGLGVGHRRPMGQFWDNAINNQH